jgi:hypothetical protein
MAQILDCLVSYFGLDEQQKPNPGRYYCYHIVAGPGPTAESGVASITTLALSNESERCTYCQTFHLVKTGGPEAAIAKAISYLDDIHQGKHVRKVQSELRGLEEERPTDATPPAPRATFAHRPTVFAPPTANESWGS